MKINKFTRYDIDVKGYAVVLMMFCYSKSITIYLLNNYNPAAYFV
jgi:hypothetical protein